MQGLPPARMPCFENPKGSCTQVSIDFGLKLVGTSGPKSILFGYMDPQGKNGILEGVGISDLRFGRSLKPFRPEALNPKFAVWGFRGSNGLVVWVSGFRSYGCRFRG